MEEWIASKEKEINVGDGTRKTFHYVMGTWNDEENKSKDEDGFGIESVYSSDRGRS